MWTRICSNKEDPITLSTWDEFKASDDVVSVLPEDGDDPDETKYGRPDKTVPYYKFPLGQWLTDKSYQALKRKPPYSVFQMQSLGTTDLIGTALARSQLHGARERIHQLIPVQTRAELLASAQPNDSKSKTSSRSSSSTRPLTELEKQKLVLAREARAKQSALERKQALQRLPAESHDDSDESDEEDSDDDELDAKIAEFEEYRQRNLQEQLRREHLRVEEERLRLKQLQAKALADARKARADKAARERKHALERKHEVKVNRPKLLKRDPTEIECAMYLSAPHINPMTGKELPCTNSRVGRAIKKRCKELYQNPPAPPPVPNSVSSSGFVFGVPPPAPTSASLMNPLHAGFNPPYPSSRYLLGVRTRSRHR